MAFIILCDVQLFINIMEWFLYSSNTDRNKTNDDSSKNVNGMVRTMVANVME